MSSQHANGPDGSARKVVRFGVFELDARAGELRKQGIRLRLQGKPLQVLEALLESPGQVVTREELRRRLWPSDIFIDFDSGLNTAANRLRIALGDSADGRSDILWRDVSGQLAIWFAGDAMRTANPSYRNAARPVDQSLQVQGITDYNADGYADILWRSADGQVAIWLLEGGRFVSDVYPRAVDASWQIKGVVTDVR